MDSPPLTQPCDREHSPARTRACGWETWLMGKGRSTEVTGSTAACVVWAPSGTFDSSILRRNPASPSRRGSSCWHHPWTQALSLLQVGGPGPLPPNPNMQDWPPKGDPNTERNLGAPLWSQEPSSLGRAGAERPLLI